MAGFLDTQSTTNQTEAIYIAYFTRAGDGPGVVFWTDAFANFVAGGATIDQAATLIAQSFAVQPEATATYAFLAAPPNPLNPSNPTQIAGVDAFIEQVYQNLFNRSADSAGLAFWQNAILTGQVTVGAAVYTIANGATGSDQTVLANKIAAAEFFTTDTFGANLGTTNPLSPTFLAEAHASVTNVTSPTTLAESQASTTAYIAAPLGTFVLTVNEDTVTPQSSNVLGTAGGAGETLTNGDVISGNAAQTVTIQVTDSTAAPGVAIINGSGLVNLVVSASNNLSTVTNGGFNALQWGTTTPIGTVEITPTAQNTVTGISNASPTGIGLIELNAANNNASLYVGFNASGVGNFAIDSGVSTANPGTLDATGTTIFANGLANALTAANIQFTGTNWDVINLGTNAHNVTLTGTGTDFVTFGALPTSGGLNVDFHTMGNAQNLTFQVGALNTNTGNVVTIEGGGLAANDTVTALGMTTTEALHLSGVDNLVTDFRGGNMTFDGTNVVGLQTLTVNAAPGAAQPGFVDDFINMTVDPLVLNINGPVNQVNFDAVGLAGMLTVNFGGNAAAITFDGLAVIDVASLTVNFNDAGGFKAGSAVGEINADLITTTFLEVTNGAASARDTVALGGTAALTQLTIQATANSAVMHVTNALVPVVINAPHASVNVTAVATDSTAWLSGVADLSNLSNDAFHVVTVFAEGDGSVATIGPHAPHITGPFDLTTLGGITEIDITAGGANSVAHLTDFLSGGSVGNINVTARGASSSATISTGTIALGSINSINVSALGADSTALIKTIDPLAIQNVNITASGVHSTAVIEHLVGLTGNVANITITASGNTAFAGLVGLPNAVALGDISSINVTASGDDSAAVLFLPTFTFSNINQVNVTASGDGSFALGEVTALNTIQAASVTASGVGSLAVEILDPLFIGTVTVTTSALGDGDPIIHPPSEPFIPIPPVLLVGGIAGLFSGGGGSESTAVLVYGDHQVTNGGVINASGAGFFDLEQTAHGGFTANALNTGGFSFLVGFSGFTDDHALTTTIHSSSVFNFVQAGVEFMNISTGTATGTSTPGNLQGNTFDLGTAWSLGNYDPFGNHGAGISTLLQWNAGNNTVASETITAGFTSGGTNASQTQGQLEFGHGLGAGSATNFVVDTSTSIANFITAALTDLHGAVHYVADTIGGNTWLAVGNANGATDHHILQVVELVGQSMVAHDIIA